MAGKKSPTAIAIQQEFLRKKGLLPDKKSVKKRKELAIDRRSYSRNLGLNCDDKEFGIYISSINNCAVKIDMEDKKVIELIISHYDHVLNHIIRPDVIYDFERVKKYIITNSCHKGICFYSRVVLGVSITDSDWIDMFSSGNKIYWYTTPERCTSSKEIVDCISFRLSRLTEILNRLKEEDG